MSVVTEWRDACLSSRVRKTAWIAATLVLASSIIAAPVGTSTASGFHTGTVSRWPVRLSTGDSGNVAIQIRCGPGTELANADSDDVDQSFRCDGDQRGAERREAFSV